jgi:hypothetical protein
MGVGTFAYSYIFEKLISNFPRQKEAAKNES